MSCTNMATQQALLWDFLHFVSCFWSVNMDKLMKRKAKLWDKIAVVEELYLQDHPLGEAWKMVCMDKLEKWIGEIADIEEQLIDMWKWVVAPLQ